MARRASSPVEAIGAALEAVRRGGHSPERLLVAFSGGLDSSVLLAAASALAASAGLALSAVHFDHGWSEKSATWAAHCVARAASFGVVCELERFATPAAAGASKEAFGRQLRYAALARRATAGTLVLTAHHADDLAETFLLMALRGSGPQGLAAIAPCRPLGEGMLVRPFLALGRSTLEGYALAHGLQVLADPSNADERFDRNYLRHRIMPAVLSRWPAAAATLQRAAQLQQDAALVLDESARLALATLGASTGRLPLAGLLRLSPAMQRLVLRQWLAAAGLPTPDAARIEELRTVIPAAGQDRNPLLRWPGGCVRRYDDALWIDEAIAPWPEGGTWRWSPPTALALPGGRLEARGVEGEGLSVARLAGHVLEVRGRCGGERLRLPGHRHSKTLKHLWQEARLPPWQRYAWPLVYLGETLVAVPDIGVAASLAAGPGEPGWVLHWASGVHPA